jgi:hypothetical protein
MEHATATVFAASIGLIGYEPKKSRNFNNLQDAGGPSKSLVRSAKESLSDS